MSKILTFMTGCGTGILAGLFWLKLRTKDAK